jgi:hypothetical protein
VEADAKGNPHKIIAGRGRPMSIQDFTRRAWLGLGAVSLTLWPMAGIQAQTAMKKATLTAEDEKVVGAVRDTGRKAGLRAFDAKSSEHFLAVGDGRPDYGSGALEHSEAIARDFLAHFRKLGFQLAFPARRMAIVALKDNRTYKAFSADDTIDETVGGHYDPDANWLVIFDFRAGKGGANAQAKRINTFTLVHETVHLLSYNTGLQTAQGDVPACISEGLGTYGELWTRAGGSAAFGMVNEPRLSAMIAKLDQGLDWIPISRLLTDDNLFRDTTTANLAYGEAWVLVHLLMASSERRKALQAYLAEVPKIGAQPTKARDRYAAQKLGDLDALDLAVRRHAQHMARKKRLSLPTRIIRGRD